MELETLLCCLVLPRYNIIGKSGYMVPGDKPNRSMLIRQLLTNQRILNISDDRARHRKRAG